MYVFVCVITSAGGNHFQYRDGALRHHPSQQLLSWKASFKISYLEANYQQGQILFQIFPLFTEKIENVKTVERFYA